MTTYRSTTLRIASQHCPKALDFYEARAPYDRDVFATGVAAHAFLEAAAAKHDGTPLWEVFDDVAHALVVRGRSFDGDLEPPLRAEAVHAGRGLAQGWLEDHPLDFRCQPEKGFAVDRDWKPVPYSSDKAYYKGVLDLVFSADVEDEEYAMTVVTARDYKTSWRDGADKLDSVQMRGQAVLLRAVYPDAGAISIEVANLRTGGLYRKTIVMDEEGEATLATWRKEIDLAITAADVRTPRPGAGCVGCPYLLRCDAALGFMRGTVLGELELRLAVGTRLAVATAVVDELTEKAKVLASEAPIAIGTGFVGFEKKERRSATEDAPRLLARAWLKGEETDAVVGLVAALSPGVTACESVAKKLFNKQTGSAWKEARQELLDQTLETENYAKFGVYTKE